MDLGIHAQLFQGAQIEFLNVVGGRLDDHLELVVVLQAVRVFTVAAVGGTAGRLHVGAGDGLRAQGTQTGHGVGSTGTHFHIQRLNDGTALAGPIVLQLQDQALKGFDIEFLHSVFRAK
ncbi:hypothetical protein D3C71_1563170 [compost metagenome]